MGLTRRQRDLLKMAPPTGVAGHRRRAMFAAGPAIPDSVVDNFEDEPGGVYGEGQDISDFYSGATGAYDRITEDKFEGEKSLFSDSNSTDEIVSTPGDGLNRYPERGDTIVWNLQAETDSDPSLLFGASGVDNYYDAQYRVNGNEIRIRKVENGSIVDLNNTSVSPQTNEWLEAELEWTEGDQLTFKVFTLDTNGDRDTELGSVQATDSTFQDNRGVGYGSFTDTGGRGVWFDNVRVM